MLAGCFRIPEPPEREPRRNRGRRLLSTVRDQRSAFGRRVLALLFLAAGGGLFAANLASQTPEQALAIVLDIEGVIGPATSD